MAVDTSPSALNQAFGGFMTGNVGSLLVDILVWTIIIIALLAIFGAVYIFVTYKYKITIFKVYGSVGEKQSYSIGKPKKDFARVAKDGGWKLLFAHKDIEPIESKHIYPGNRVYLYEIDGILEPGKIACGKDNFQIEPVPYSVRKKTELELQQLEQDFAKGGAWEANKIFIYMLIGGAMVLCLAGFVIWLAFKKTDQVVPALQTFSESLKNVNTISGKG